jgi:PAS domain S-box-containing protein
MPQKRRFSRLLFRAVVTPIAALSILAALLAWQVTHLASLGGSLDRADQVIAEASTLELLMIDMEAAVRGYLLSGQERFLEPWAPAQARVAPTLDRMTALAADNPAQERRVVQLRDGLRSWMESAQAAAATHRRDLADMDQRRAVMETLRARVDAFIQTEEALRTSRNQSAQQGATMTLGAALAGTLLVGLVIALATRQQLLHVAELYGSVVTERELVLQSAGDGIYGVDSTGRITFLNPAGASMLGFTPDEAIGRDGHELCHRARADGRPYPVEECPIYAAFRDGAVHRVDDEVFWRKNGSSFPVAYVSTPIRWAGILEGAVVSFRDVTCEKEREADRQRLLERAQAGNQARDQVLSIASHALRTPLTSLKMHMELLAKRLERNGGGDASRDARSPLEKCMRQLGRLERVVDELLDAARVHAGDIELRPEPVDLAQVVSDCAEKLRSRVSACGCSLVLHLDQPMVGAWDREKLPQVVSHLIANAVESGRGEPVDVSLRAESRDAVLSVHHCGRGVAEEDRERLFEPLAPADADHRSPGLGVGLYVTRELVRAMGGTVSVQSTPEPGSILRVRLPREVPPTIA